MRVFGIVLCLATLCVSALPAFAGDPANGEKVFRKCKACHDVGEGARNKVGPVLNGVVGSEVASVADFKYSKAFLAKKDEGLVWTEVELNTYLKKPRDYIKGTKMSFPGLKTDEDRADVIAYLAQFN